MGSNNQLWLWEKLREKCKNALKKNGFEAHLFSTGEEAKKGVMDMISGYETFGVGGSDTVRSLGIVDELSSMGKTVYDHWKEGLSPEESMNYRLNQGRCDCFLCSANAISATGEIINSSSLFLKGSCFECGISCFEFLNNGQRQIYLE